MVGLGEYLKGRNFEKKRDWNSAARVYRKSSATMLGSRVAHVHYRLGFVFCKLRKWNEAIVALERANELRVGHAHWVFRIGNAYESAGRAVDAADSYRSAIGLRSDRFQYHDRLIGLLLRKGKFWQAIEAIEVCLESHEPQSEILGNLGDANAQMGRLDASIESYRNALDMDDSSAAIHFSLASVLERAGQMDEAAVSYSAWASRAKDIESSRYGPGVVYEKRGDWTAAAGAYDRHLIEIRDDPSLWHRVGVAHARCHNWVKAERALECALGMDLGRRTWHRKLGYVREKLEDWVGAALAYSAAAALAPAQERGDFYRIGYCLSRTGRLSDACAAYAESMDGRVVNSEVLFESDRTAGGTSFKFSTVFSSDDLKAFGVNLIERGCRDYLVGLPPWQPLGHLLRARLAERKADWNGAALAYAAAIGRSEIHEPTWDYCLGKALTAGSRHEEACAAFENTQILRRAHEVPVPGYEKDAVLRAGVNYTEFRNVLPIKAKTILFESYGGVRLGCNPYAIFRDMLSREEFNDWTFYWVLNDKSRIPSRYRQLENVIYLSKECHRYIRCLAEVEVLVNNSTFPTYFIRRDGQRYLNTWHGTPLKTLGKDIKSVFFEHKNTARNFLQASHIISPNSHTTGVLLSRNDVCSITTARVAETGYPRIDLTLNLPQDERETLRTRLRIGEGQKVILYAPTFRGSLAERRVDVSTLLEDITSFSVQGARLLFRGHYFVEDRIGESSLREALVPPDIDTNELLSIVDVLVTDYSSVSFDFLVTEKPIIYYVPDLESYADERGFYFEMNEMPGEKCAERTRVQVAIVRALSGVSCDSEVYQRAKAKFVPHEDGGAAERVMSLLFEEQPACCRSVDDRRKSVLFFAGDFAPNGITTSFLNLARSLDPEKYAITLLIDPAGVSSELKQLAKFSELPEFVQAVGRVGRMLYTAEEKWALELFNQCHGAVAEGVLELCRTAYRREFRRMLGPFEFDAVINFDGYNQFWPAVFAFVDGATKGRNAIYLHNDMHAEWVTRFPTLETTFRLYANYEKIVSVSKRTCDRNLEHLAARFELASEKFVYCDNLHGRELIQRRSKEALADKSHESLFRPGGHTFVTMGRLSPEKDHAKLVSAFAKVHTRHPGVRLCILGEGPLRASLEGQVRKLGVHRAVHLLGRVDNPFPYLAKADCFVLSSNHEGQPMVLFEAMILGKPIIATDIVGSRSAIEGRSGLLVENSESGLIGGMESFVSGEVVHTPFDYDDYHSKGLRQFECLVAGNIS